MTLDDTINRLKAFEAAGADVLYAPGLANLDDVATVLGEVSKPVNVLTPFLPGISREAFAELDVARLSVGAALAGHVTKALVKAAENLLTTGQIGG